MAKQTNVRKRLRFVKPRTGLSSTSVLMYGAGEVGRVEFVPPPAKGKRATTWRFTGWGGRDSLLANERIDKHEDAKAACLAYVRRELKSGRLW